ncbi:hypothetical protein TIFTF001_036884 [Ficus carica]|uniref:RING-type domain-containing protein n=1 Tax=Ficus carica TaxID=3494 RepID=A0AA88E551_FICCA|nr:hypothetical protein TIFTF001_036870 [Ficus carica]GMN67816.1 hypothetical protein TIFTF001_036874 [Ficus carica]GMN67823.1 hypothetical protein TIFTF001_036880 [Ficus carica]GMN67826.1 hypothetical protein TIFTF001_036884 [Ficus carica]
MDKTASSVLSTTELMVSIAIVKIVMMLISYCISRRMSLPEVQLPDHHHPNIDSSGDDDRQNIVENSIVIDEEALERFPKLIYSQMEKRKIFGNELGNCTSSCSVCLADYKESDVLRMLPHCGHVFHLIKCVDSWLRLRPTSPLCRSSPDIAVASTTPDHGEHDQVTISLPITQHDLIH